MITHSVFVFLWLITLSIIPSKPTHVVANGKFSFFMIEQYSIIVSVCMYVDTGFPGGSVVKNPPAKAGDMGLIPGLGRFPGEENGNPLQYSCLENPLDRGVWKAIVHEVSKSWTWLNDQTHTHMYICTGVCLYLTSFFKFLFIWPWWVWVAALRIFDFSCGMWDEVPQPGLEPRPPALSMWCL